MDIIQKLEPFLQKKSVRAKTLPNYDKLDVLGVSNRLGIIKTNHKKSKDLSKYQLIETGDFAYNPYRINVGSIGLVPDGVKGLVSPAYVVFSTTKNLLPELLLNFLKSDEGLFQIAQHARGTVRKALRFDDLCKIKMPVPSLEIQRDILRKKGSIQVEIDELETELTYQQTLLEKLHQAILQEAIQGKLTATWRAENPDVEPASDLLARIQAEKAVLLKAKKIRKQKPVPPITADEIPFELPAGWVWCRLGDYVLFERGKFSIRPRNDPSCFGGKYPFIQISSLDDKGSVVNTFSQTLNEKGFSVSKYFEKGTIMVAIVGGTIGNLGVLGRDMCFTDSIVGVRPRDSIYQEYILLLMRYYRPKLRKLAYQMAGQPNIKLLTLNNLILALPPLAEQRVIVAKVNALLAVCNELTAHNQTVQQQAATLMQAVLQEAFNN